MAALKVGYEWVVEDIDAHEDIADTQAWETAAEALREFKRPLDDGIVRRDFCLTRNAGNDEEGLQDRQWAYTDSDFRLPAEFDGGKPVLDRHVEELAKAREKVPA